MALGGHVLKKLENRRQTERRKVLWGARLANLEGSRSLKCLARDNSCAGARVDIESQQFVEDKAYFLDLRARMAYEARVVWQKAPELGLQFIRSYRFDELPSPEVARQLEAEYRAG
jgi:hypothetical protein